MAANRSMTLNMEAPVPHHRNHPGVRCLNTPGKGLEAGESPYLQAKLKVGPPDDAYEHEADRIADQVMRMPEPGLKFRGDGECQASEWNTLALLQRSLTGGGQTTVAPSSVHDGLRSPGKALDSNTRIFMESQFGRDFRHVRVHSQGNADRSAKAIGARAYTIGRDVVFAGGQYAPGTAIGRKLLAHELTHVVQQSESAAGPNLIVRRQTSSPLRGRRTSEMVDYRAESQVDTALRESKILWAYIGDKIEKGTKIRGSITYLKRKEFEEAYIAYAGRTVGAKNKAGNVGGFYDPKRDRIVLPLGANLESMIHEAIHKFADSSFRQVFTPGLDEGVTQYFTNLVLQEYGLSRGKAYPKQVIAGEALAAAVGLEDLALGFFLGPAFNVLKTLSKEIQGFDTNRFMGAIREENVDWRKVAALLSSAAQSKPPPRPSPSGTTQP